MKRLLILLFLLLPFALFMLSCASTGKNWGSSVQDADIRAKFERYEYVADYNYFYTGPASSPKAILGIQQEFELVRDVGRGGSKTNWQQFEPEGTKLKEYVEAMNIPGRGGRPFGFNIKTSTGEEIGVMYTRSWGGWSEAIYLHDGNRLSVMPSVYNQTLVDPIY